MWSYEKRLQYPVNIKEPNAKIAQVIMSQYGGPDGELGASMRYISQRYSMPYNEVAAILTDIGTSCLKCSHTSHQRLMLDLTLFSICAGENLNKHQNALCQKLQFYQL